MLYGIIGRADAEKLWDILQELNTRIVDTVDRLYYWQYTVK